MHRRIVCSVIVVALVAVGAFGCKRQARISNKLAPVASQIAKPPAPVAHAPPPVQPPSPALQNEKSAYVASARAQMDQMQQSIAKLQATTWKTSGPSRAEYDKLLRDVAAKRAAFQVDVASIPAASAESWPALKAKSDRDLVAMRGAVQVAASRIVPSPVTAAKLAQ